MSRFAPPAEKLETDEHREGRLSDPVFQRAPPACGCLQALSRLRMPKDCLAQRFAWNEGLPELIGFRQRAILRFAQLLRRMAEEWFLSRLRKPAKQVLPPRAA